MKTRGILSRNTVRYGLRRNKVDNILVIDATNPDGDFKDCPRGIEVEGYPYIVNSGYCRNLCEHRDYSVISPGENIVCCIQDKNPTEEFINSLGEEYRRVVPHSPKGEYDIEYSEFLEQKIRELNKRLDILEKLRNY